MITHLRSTYRTWTRRTSQALLAGAGLALLSTGAMAAQPAAGTPSAGTPAPPAVAAPPAGAAASAPTPSPTPPPPTLPPLPELTTPPLPAECPTPVPLGRPITVEEAIRVALANQPQVGIASAQAAAAAGRTQQAVSGYYPTANLSASRNELGSHVAGHPSVSSGNNAATVSVNQLIYDFGRTPAAVGEARSNQAAAQQGFVQTTQDVVNDVKQAYYTLLQNQRLVEVQRSNVAAQQAHLELTQARYNAGVAPHSDVVRAQTAVAEAVFLFANAENTSATSRVNLNLAMGVDVRTPTTVVETDEPVPPGANAADMVALALSRRPLIAQLRADLRAAEEAVKIARTTDLPDIFFDATYGVSGSDFPPGNNNWSYGVGVAWPFYSDGLTRGRVEEAQANVRAAEETLRQGEQTVSTEVVQAYLDVQTAEQNVISSNSQVASAEESARAAAGRYAAGVAAYIEVIDAQNALLLAQVNQVNARYGLSLARAALARALATEGY